MQTADSTASTGVRQPLTPDQLHAIEHFAVRPGLDCVTSGSPRVPGSAATSKNRPAGPPLIGSFYLGRTDWWAAIKQLPVSRIAVIQDMNPNSSLGSALGVSKIDELPFPVFASSRLGAADHRRLPVAKLSRDRLLTGIKSTQGEHHCRNSR
jgi:hypothetical protein